MARALKLIKSRYLTGEISGRVIFPDNRVEKMNNRDGQR